MFGLRSAQGRTSAALVLLVVLFVATAAAAVWSTRDHQSRLDSLEQRSRAAVALESARSNFYMEAAGLMGGLFAPGSGLPEEATLGRVGLHDDLAKARTALEATGDTEALLLLDDLTASIGELEGTIDQVLPIVETGGTAAAINMFPRMADAVEDTSARLGEMVDGQRAAFASQEDAARLAADRALWVVIVLASGAFLLAVGGALVLTGSVVRALASLRAKVKAITDGDLQARAEVYGPEEVASLARDFNEMTDALAAKTKEYIDTANLTGDIIVRLDKDGRFTFLNDSACQFFGKPREGLLGVEVEDYLHPKDMQSAAQAVREMRDSKRPATGFVSRYVTPAGIRVVEWNGYPLFDEGGRYAGLQGTGRDITERKQMEEALAAKTREYVDTTNLTGDIIVRLDEPGRLTFLNDAACQFFGKSREELLGTRARAFVHPDDLGPAVQAGQEARARKELVRGFELRAVTPAGIRVVEWNGCPLFDDDERFTGLQITGRDITERKQMEEALAARAEEYVATTNSTGDIIAKADEKGRWTFLNDAACQFLGKSRDELLGTDARATLHPEDLESTVRAAEEAAATRDQITGRDITERNQMEETLRESEERFRSLSASAPIGIFVTDAQGKCVYANPRLLEIAGLTLEESLGYGWGKVIHPDDRDALLQEASKAAGQGDDFSHDLRILTPEGKLHWAHVYTSPMFSTEGNVIGRVGTLEDITERRRAEDALRGSEERFRQVAETSQEWIWEFDAEGHYTYSSPAVQDLLGYEPEELIGKHFLHFVAPEETEEILVGAKDVLAKREPFLRVTVKKVRKDGRTVVVESTGRPILDAEENVLGYRGVDQDISERKQAEEALASSEERLKILFEFAPDAYYMNDLQGNFVDGNKAAEELIGYKREEVIGRSLLEANLLLPEELSRAAANMAKNAQGMPTGPDEFTLVRKDGTKVPAEIRTFPVNIGNETLALGIARDVTERKQAEEALRESEDKYRRLVQDSVDGIVIVEGLEVRFVNRAALEILGYQSEEEVLGRPFTDFVSPECRGLMTERAHARQKGEDVPSRYEFTAVRKDGTEFPAELSVGRITYQGRGAVQGIIRDIGERRKAEEALQDSEKRYRLLAQNASDVIWTMDMNLRYTYVSPSITRMRGYSVEEVMTQTVNESMTPASRDLAVKTLAEELAIEKMEHKDVTRSRALELEMNCKDGSTLWCEMKMIFLRDQDGRPTGILGVTRDISERKRAEDALRDSEERLRSLVTNAPVILFAIDREGVFTLSEGKGLAGLGLRPGQVVRRSVHDVFRDAPHIMEYLQRALEGEEFTATLEVGPLIFETHYTPMRDQDGEITGGIGVAIDVTEREKAEQERGKLHAELQVRAITDSLTGLYDHAHFYRRLGEEIERCKRYDHRFALVMMDVDDFKRFNDSRGHQVGDDMLNLVADCIRSGLRRSDLAFRYGGDEFAAILPYADSAKAGTVVNRINRHITKSLRQRDGGDEDRLSVSAGVACFPDDGTAADDLVRIADAALYSSKWVARARDIMGQREDIQSLVSALVSRRAGVEGPASGAAVRPEALHEQHARVVSSVASSIAVALKDAGVAQALEDPDLQILAVVGAAAEIKDRYIRGHPERTSTGAVALAEEIGLTAERVRDIRIAGLLHDIGKVTVSEGILNKPGRLTRREFVSIRDHPIVGSTLVSQVRGFERLVPIIRHHHERFDGKGYPDGLAGEKIPVEARILSVVDVYDALTHERSYRKALTRQDAIAELERGAGTQFDPLLVEAFLALVKKRGEGRGTSPQAAAEEKHLTAAKAVGSRKR
jgi:diguanylate cyclase (GGDEF)-like protein/PAS domain S-box-containing protein